MGKVDVKEPFGNTNVDFMIEVWAEGDLKMKEMALVQKKGYSGARRAWV